MCGILSPTVSGLPKTSSLSDLRAQQASEEANRINGAGFMAGVENQQDGLRRNLESQGYAVEGSDPNSWTATKTDGPVANVFNYTPDGNKFSQTRNRRTYSVIR